MIEDDAVTEDVYMERLNEMLDLGAQADKDSLQRAGLTSAGNELMSIWNDMDKGQIEEKDAFQEADNAIRNKQASAEP